VVARIASAGGVADVLLEHFDPVHRLLVFGANPGSLALAGLAAPLGWQVRLFDSAEPPPGAVACVHATPDTLPRYVTGDRSTSAVVMTHNFERDVAWLRALERVPLAYLGAIGSRERAARIRALPGLGTRLHCPAGLDIGAGTPEQIAVSVIAEILSVRNRRGTANRAPAREAVTA
jgi:xanthine/CO dehydrogenase XdhC/CoxF family maturation factor